MNTAAGGSAARAGMVTRAVYGRRSWSGHGGLSARRSGNDGCKTGHSVAVLLQIYAKCVAGQEDAARRRIAAALGAG